MIKIRLEYADNQNGIEELQKVLEVLVDVLGKDFTILSKSKPYHNRNKNSSYKRLYVEIEEK